MLTKHSLTYIKKLLQMSRFFEEKRSVTISSKNNKIISFREFKNNQGKLEEKLKKLSSPKIPPQSMNGFFTNAKLDSSCLETEPMENQIDDAYFRTHK